MPWNRNDPDPIEIKRRQLAEQQRLLAEQMSRLTEELHHTGQPAADPRSAEPPVWRMEDDSHSHERPVPEPTSAGRRALARQRRRDMILFFACILLLLVAVAIFYWLFNTHYAPSTPEP